MLSIIIPTHNRPFFLKDLINTLSTVNSGDKLEIIVVDDFSSEENAKKNKKICKDVKYFYTDKSLGAAGARNFGMRKSKFKYLWFIDDDDQPFKSTIYDVINFLTENSPDVLLLPKSTFFNELKINSYYPKEDDNNFKTYRKYGQKINTSCAIFLKSILDDIGGWDETLVSGQDTDIFLRVSQKYNFKTIETKPIIQNVGHLDRITTNFWNQQKGKIQFLKKHWKLLSFRRKLHYIISFVLLTPIFRNLKIRLKVLIKKLYSDFNYTN